MWKTLKRHPEQQKLLDIGQTLPNGLVYRPDFLTPNEEDIVLAYLENLHLEHATHTVHTATEDLHIAAKRRHAGFGWGWDYRRERLVPGEPLPRFMHGMQQKIAKWLDIAPARVAEALINEYTPGAAIGWHVDNEGFEKIIGISLKGWATMRFRPLPWQKKHTSPTTYTNLRSGEVVSSASVSLQLEPRSAYIMQGPVRWEWQHSVAKVEALRYSITFRTLPKGVVDKY